MSKPSNPNRFGLKAGYKNGTLDRAPSDVPDRHGVAILSDNVSCDGNEFARLIDCHGTLFVLRMTANRIQVDYVENKRLQLMRNTLDKNGEYQQSAD